MEKYLNMGIKDVIAEFPEVGKILEDFMVGCVTCAVGTCLLKQVVEIHYLQPAQETELMYRIEKAIYPERQLENPAITGNGTDLNIAAITYSEPVQELVDEHKLIKRLLALIPWLVDKMNTTGFDRQVVLDSVDFIRSYADRYHHAKEEDILFKYVDETQEIIQVMYEEHTRGRNHVKAVLEAVEDENTEVICNNLLGYRELLTEHIKKEDELLYPWIDRQLNPNQVEELKQAFNRVNIELGLETQEKYENFIVTLEQAHTSSL
ncbi:MAG: hemerythrin domain-containing protein [Clostridia bacterium]|nr:hemerythrin domain-containing protein [Clostridia bacterium]